MNNPDNPLPFLKRFVSDSWSILNLIGAIALLLILLFYSPDQAVWSHAYLSDEPIRHPFGYAGAWAADVILSLLGFSAYLLPLLLLLNAYNSVYRFNFDGESIFFQVGGLALLLTMVGALLALYWPVKINELATTAGGIFGQKIAVFFLRLYETKVAVGVLLLLLLCGVSMLLHIDWPKLAHFIGYSLFELLRRNEDTFQMKAYRDLNFLSAEERKAKWDSQFDKIRTQNMEAMAFELERAGLTEKPVLMPVDEVMPLPSGPVLRPSPYEEALPESTLALHMPAPMNAPMTLPSTPLNPEAPAKRSVSVAQALGDFAGGPAEALPPRPGAPTPAIQPLAPPRSPAGRAAASRAASPAAQRADRPERSASSPPAPLPPAADQPLPSPGTPSAGPEALAQRPPAGPQTPPRPTAPAASRPMPAPTAKRSPPAQPDRSASSPPAPLPPAADQPLPGAPASILHHSAPKRSAASVSERSAAPVQPLPPAADQPLPTHGAPLHQTLPPPELTQPTAPGEARPRRVPSSPGPAPTISPAPAAKRSPPTPPERSAAPVQPLPPSLDQPLAGQTALRDSTPPRAAAPVAERSASPTLTQALPPSADQPLPTAGAPLHPTLPAPDEPLAPAPGEALPRQPAAGPKRFPVESERSASPVPARSEAPVEPLPATPFSPSPPAPGRPMTVAPPSAATTRPLSFAVPPEETVPPSPRPPAAAPTPTPDAAPGRPLAEGSGFIPLRRPPPPAENPAPVHPNAFFSVNAAALAEAEDGPLTPAPSSAAPGSAPLDRLERFFPASAPASAPTGHPDSAPAGDDVIILPALDREAEAEEIWRVGGRRVRPRMTFTLMEPLPPTALDSEAPRTVPFKLKARALQIRPQDEPGEEKN